MRVFIGSPYRVLLWAALVVVIRHLLAREAPVYRDLPARIRSAWRTAAVRTSVSATVGTRLPILLVGYLAIFLVGFRVTTPWRVDPNEFVNLQARADTGW